MKIKKGDKVLIIKGKERGKSGVIIKIIPDSNRVMIEGLNLYKKHTRPKRMGEKGQLVQIARPINVSNIQLLCKNCQKPVRVGYKVEERRKFRICKKCKSEL